MSRKHLTPNEGGCWFCSMDQCDSYDREFDTFYHEECLSKALIPWDDGSIDVEAEIINNARANPLR
jgi:hypothetical protein